MAQLIPINSFSNKFSENVLSVGTAFLDENQTVNITSGTGNVFPNLEIEGAINYGFDVRHTNFDTTDLSFNFGNTLSTNIFQKGVYLFQISIKDDNEIIDSFQDFDFEVLVYRSGLLTDTLQGTFSFDGDTYNRKWATFSQNIVFEDGEPDLDFAFTIKHNPLSPVTINEFQMGNIKLELDDKFLTAPTPYSLPKSVFSQTSDLYISETQWDVADIGPQVVADGASLNLLTLINNATNKNTLNTDVFDELNIVSNSIVTTYRGCKIIHTIRISLNILTGSDQFYQVQIRRTIDDSVVYRNQIKRSPDETIQTIEMTTRTLSDIDPFTVDGFYIAFVNNSGASATIDNEMSLVVISKYQKAQKQ